jgi:uncharacterized protein
VKLDLSPEHLAILRRIFQAHTPGAKLYIFGSRAQGRAKPYSDVDLILEMVTPLPLLDRACLQMALEESDLPMRVDWLMTQDAPEFVRSQLKSHQAIAINE